MVALDLAGHLEPQTAQTGGDIRGRQHVRHLATSFLYSPLFPAQEETVQTSAYHPFAIAPLFYAFQRANIRQEHLDHFRLNTPSALDFQGRVLHGIAVHLLDPFGLHGEHASTTRPAKHSSGAESSHVWARSASYTATTDSDAYAWYPKWCRAERSAASMAHGWLP